jgi:hypothetical protein
MGLHTFDAGSADRLEDTGRYRFCSREELLGRLDGALSTMTFHEFATGESVAELGRIISESGPLVVVDWSAAGSGDHGPPLEERYDVLEAMELLETAGFEISYARERVDTFLAVVTA